MEQEVKVQHQAWLLWEKQWYAAVTHDLETRLTSYSLAATPPSQPIECGMSRSQLRPTRSQVHPTRSQLPATQGGKGLLQRTGS